MVMEPHSAAMIRSTPALSSAWGCSRDGGNWNWTSAFLVESMEVHDGTKLIHAWTGEPLSSRKIWPKTAVKFSKETLKGMC
jgi:hypothetical protein